MNQSNIMKKLIWIGEGCWFPDSLKIFCERGVQITVIRSSQKYGWAKHYKLFESFAKVVDWNSGIVSELALDNETVVIGGGNFMNISKEYVNPGIMEYAHEQLDILYRISKFNSEYHSGAKCIRWFNGDTGFGTPENIELFSNKIQYVDTLIFDNDQLREFVLTNIPSARDKNTLIGWIETPLERFVNHNNRSINKQICCLGRFLCSTPSYITNFKQLPIKKYPLKHLNLIDRIKGRKRGYQMAGATDNMDALLRARELFYRFESTCAFGLSHMYDTFSGSVEDYRRHKDFYFSIFGQNFPHNVCSCYEAYYPFCNNVNKDVCYLMNGIIPLISHMEHNVYREMIKREMAILIKNPWDVKNVLNMPNQAIQRYRDNIYKNRDLFTFDHVADMIMDLSSG